MLIRRKGETLVQFIWPAILTVFFILIVNILDKLGKVTNYLGTTLLSISILPLIAGNLMLFVIK